MKVTNAASFAVIAFGWHATQGYGEDVRIAPGQTADVNGPYLGEMGGGECFVALSGKIFCHEGPDDDSAFRIGRGSPLSLGGHDRGVTVRHFADMAEPHITTWREAATVYMNPEPLASVPSQP